MTRRLLVVPLLAALTVLVGCEDWTPDAELQGRCEELEAENKRLSERLDALAVEVRPLDERVNDVDRGSRQLERALVRAEQGLRSRIREMMQQGRGREGRVFVRPAPAIVERAEPAAKPKPYMGFDGQTIIAEVTRGL